MLLKRLMNHMLYYKEDINLFYLLRNCSHKLIYFLKDLADDKKLYN